MAREATEKLIRTAGDSYKMVVDHALAMQERNVGFARGVIEGSAREARSQAESTRVMALDLFERTEKQREAFRGLIRESVDTYLDLLYAPFSYYKQGLQIIEGEANGAPGSNGVVLPIPNYDKLNVGEVSKRLDGLSAEELRRVRDYERRHKNRESVIEQLDRKLRPTAS